MDSYNPVQLIDALTEITCHNSNEEIGRGLLKVLMGLNQSNEYWLYQVSTQSVEHSIDFLVGSSNSSSVISAHASIQSLPLSVSEGVTRAVNEVNVQIIPADDLRQGIFVIYPAKNSKHNIFAVLVEKTCSSDPEGQQLVYGLLRVYSNYLYLLDQLRRDKLTGLLNRETLETEISRILVLNQQNIPLAHLNTPQIDNDQRQQKGDKHFWLGVLDIDFFKRVNDTYGHLYGDEVLILVARLIEKSVRNDDLIFRYGGEEFVILIQASDLDDARFAFDRIRLAISAHHYAKADKITVSVGVTQLGLQSGPTDVIAEADEALYFAKNHGRDQARHYQELVDQKLIDPPEESFEIGEISFF